MAIQTAYKGYLIKENQFDGMFYVSKDGFHITAQPTLEAAKAEIRLLVDWSDDFNPQAVRGEHFI